MIRHATPRLALLVGLASGLLMTGCGEEPTATAEPSPTAEAIATEQPSPVARMEPTATATVDPAEEPLAPVGSEELAGIVVPAAAELVDFVEAGEETDARADYRIEVEGVDSEVLYEWFVTQMMEQGWGEPEDRDGALIFLHETELGARFADLGQKRTATVIFDLTDEVDFSILAEAPN